MRFEEFASHAQHFIRLISEVYQRIQLLGYENDHEPTYRTQLLGLQAEARATFEKITHIVDLGCNRMVIFGDDRKRVDVFNVSLAKSHVGGCAIIENASQRWRYW